LTISLRREGLPPLELPGDSPVLFAGSSRKQKGPGATRWHELMLYGSPADAHHRTAALSYRSTWEHESEHHQVIEARDSLALVEALRALDVAAPLIGYPARSDDEARQNASRNAQLAQDLRRRFASLLSDACAALGVKEARPMGRPPLVPGETTEQLFTRVPTSVLAWVDKLRGEEERAEWLRGLVFREVERARAEEEKARGV